MTGKAPWDTAKDGFCTKSVLPNRIGTRFRVLLLPASYLDAPALRYKVASSLAEKYGPSLTLITVVKPRFLTTSKRKRDRP